MKQHEPVEDQQPVPPQAVGNFLQQRKPAAQGLISPRLEELARPCRASIFPGPPELLAEQMGPDALEVVLQELGELGGLVVGEVLGPLEQARAATGEGGLVSVPAQLGDLMPPQLVDCHVYVPHNEAVEHAQGLGNLLHDPVGVRLPHVAAHETDTGPDVVGEYLQELPQTLLGALTRHPEQSLDAGDLVDLREIGMAAAPLDLVHTTRLDAREIPFGHSPQHCLFYVAKHVLPGRLEGDCRIRRRQPLCPASQEPAVARREVPLALGSGHSLDDNPSGRTIHPPHRVHEEHRHVPQLHDLKPPGYKLVIAEPLLAAAGAVRPAVGPRLDAHFQEGLPLSDFHESLLPVDEGHERFDTNGNILEMHPAVAPAQGLTKQPHLLPKSAAGCSFLSWPARRAALSSGGKLPHARYRREAASRRKSPQAPRRRLISSKDPRRLGGNSLPRPAIAKGLRCNRGTWKEAHARSVFIDRFC